MENFDYSFFVKAKYLSNVYSLNAAAHTSIHTARTLKTSINGVGIGEKLNGENYVKVLTRDTSVKPGSLSAYYGIPDRDLVMEWAGPIRFKMPTNNHRPPFPGISVGHYKVTAGTLGCFVKDEKDKVYVLSNNHVLGNTNKGFYK